MSFQEDKYIFVKNIINKDLCRLCGQAILFKMMNHEHENFIDPQVPDAYSVYCDSITESILLQLKPDIERYTNMKLIPTYSYLRVYEPGQKLVMHRDRESCEISATLTLDFKYNDVNSDYRWPLKIITRDGKEKEIYFENGDCLIYKGCELDHGRDIFMAGKNSVQVQVFLHYVDANGSYAKKYKYDGRPGIGYKK
jgi:hypothetical protein